MNQKIEAARELLRNNQNLSMLQSVVNELSAQGVTGLLVDSWHLMSIYLQHPFSRHPPGILPINKVQEKAESAGMDLDSMINDFEVEIKKGSPEPELYLHVAQYYFDNDRAPMARSILKKGMESADQNHIINVFYCNNLSFSASNNDTFERFLLPVLNNEQDPYLGHEAFKTLYYFYICSDQREKFFDLVSKHSYTFHDNHLSYALMRLVSSSDIDYNSAVTEFIKWGDEFTNKFYSGAPDGTFTADEINNNEIYGYQTEPLVPHLYRLWRYDDKAEFQQLLSAFSREALLIYLNEQEYHGAERALTTMFKKLWEDAHNVSDADFWMIVFLHSIEVDQFIPAEVRTVIHRLSAACGTAQMKQWELKVITWWGEKSQGSKIIPMLFESAELISDGNYDRLDDDDIYLPLKVNQSSKSVGTRPIPYYSKYFLASLRNQVYPTSFLDALWFKVVRSPLINHSRKLTDVDYQLLEYFIEKLDDYDPVFVKGWLLLDNDKYSESIPLFLSVIKGSPNWYGAYRNVSCAAESLGNIQMAYEYEKMAHDNGLDIPDRHSGHLQRIADLLSDQQNIEAQPPLNVEWLYTQHDSHTMKPEQLDLKSTLSAIAYVEHFSIPGTNQYRPILSQGVNWMPGKNKGAVLARQMLLDKTAYLLGSQQGLGISGNSDGEIDFDFKLVSFTLNFKTNDNVPLLLPQLYDVLEQQLQNSSAELIQSSIRPILVNDLVDFALERFEAYDIPVNYDHGFETTAEHCLDMFPLTVCYGLFYHEIEDAAGAQREKGMSYRHTINYGLKCVRSKADRAFDERWNLQSYDRSKSASEPSAIISLMHTIGKFNL